VSRGSRFLSFLLLPASESYQAASGKCFLPLDPSKELRCAYALDGSWGVSAASARNIVAETAKQGFQAETPSV
jgi:hypothetical protein